MGRATNLNRTQYNLRCKVFETITNAEDRIKRLTNSKPIVFYARVIQDYKESHFFVDNYNTTMGNIAIETIDLKQGEIKRLDTVEYQGKKYNVENIVIEYINKSQLGIRARPDIKTIIALGKEV